MSNIPPGALKRSGNIILVLKNSDEGTVQLEEKHKVSLAETQRTQRICEMGHRSLRPPRLCEESLAYSHAGFFQELEEMFPTLMAPTKVRLKN